MKEIVSFGELMLRLNPSGFNRIVQTDSFEISFAGGEANVAVSLANFGLKSRFVTKLPENELGEAARNAIRRYGVNTDSIVWGGPRLGVYYIEKGASQRPSKVIYDRAGSSIQLADKLDFDWDAILGNARWFHFTGITPALGGNLLAICMEALQACKKKGITVSCDLNYRKKLWSKELAKSIMSELMPYVDLLIANESDAEDVFGIRADASDVENGVLNTSAYEGVARQLGDKFDIKKVAITLRTSISASVNKWAGMLYDSGKAYFSPEYTIQIVDRVGGGDSFGAGLIYALANSYSSQDAINFAVAASCLKHTIEHDFNLVSVDEVKALAAGNSSGRVQR